MAILFCIYVKEMYFSINRFFVLLFLFTSKEITLLFEIGVKIHRIHWHQFTFIHFVVHILISHTFIMTSEILNVIKTCAKYGYIVDNMYDFIYCHLLIIHLKNFIFCFYKYLRLTFWIKLYISHLCSKMEHGMDWLQNSWITKLILLLHRSKLILRGRRR